MGILEQYRSQLQRARNKKLQLSKKTQNVSKRLSDKRKSVEKASSDATRKSRQRTVASLEKELQRAATAEVEQDKAIADLQRKVEKEEERGRNMQKIDDSRAGRERTRLEQKVDRSLASLFRSTSALEARLSEVEERSLQTLTFAVANDATQRAYDIFLSYATPDENLVGLLRDELEARDLKVWMADAQAVLGESLATSIDRGIGSSRCGICFVTPSYIEPQRFWPRQELAALIMVRKRVIPVTHGLEFDEVTDFSALLGDRKGLSSDNHGFDEIAELIAHSLTGRATDD